MDLNTLLYELQRLATLVEGWRSAEKIPAIERDMALERLRTLYDTLLFADLSVGRPEPSVGIAAVPVTGVEAPEQAEERPGAGPAAGPEEPVVEETSSSAIDLGALLALGSLQAADGTPERTGDDAPAEAPAETVQAAAAAAPAAAGAEEPAPEPVSRPSGDRPMTLFETEDFERHRHKQRVIMSLYDGMTPGAGSRRKPAPAAPATSATPAVPATPATPVAPAVPAPAAEPVRQAAAAGPALPSDPDPAVFGIDRMEDAEAAVAESVAELLAEPADTSEPETPAAPAEPEAVSMPADEPADEPADKPADEPVAEPADEPRLEHLLETDPDSVDAEEEFDTDAESDDEEGPIELAIAADEASAADDDRPLAAEDEPAEAEPDEDGPADEEDPFVEMPLEPGTLYEVSADEVAGDSRTAAAVDPADDLADDSRPRSGLAAGAVLGDVINHDVQTLADRLSAPRNVASELRRSEPVADLRSAVGINDRFLMIRDLFGGDGAACDRMMATLNEFQTIDDCMIYIAENYAWNPNSDGAKLLVELLERKFA